MSEEDIDCAEEFEHGCDDCPDYDCLYRDTQWTDPTDESQGSDKKSC